MDENKDTETAKTGQEAKHTPGPWEWVKPEKWPHHDDYEVSLGGFTANGVEVLWFGDNTHYYPSAGTPPNEADARLIAAAPDMLDALRIIKACSMCAASRSTARAAIAKAEGRT